MAHNYFYATVPIKASDTAIINAVAEDAGGEWNGESECTFSSQILGMHVVRKKGCYTEKEAHDIIRSNDDFYWGGYITAVPFCKVTTNKKISDLERRIEETRQKSVKYFSEHRVGDFKSAFIGCPDCKSKINRTYFEKLKNNTSRDLCPVCRTDLASDTTKETLKKYSEKINTLLDEIEAEKKRLTKSPTHYLACAGLHS